MDFNEYQREALSTDLEGKKEIYLHYDDYDPGSYRYDRISGWLPGSSYVRGPFF